MRLLWKVLNFQLQMVTNQRLLWISDGGFCSLLLSALGLHLVPTHGGPEHSASVYVSLYSLYVLLVILFIEGLVFLVSSISSGSYTVSASSSLGFSDLCPNGRDLIVTPHLVLCVSMSFTLCI